MLAKALMPLAEKLDRKFGWQRLPYSVGLATLIGLRERLRQNNLYSTGVPAVERPQPPGAREARRTDGSFNDLSQPGMGTAGAPFGRNGPAFPDPDPLGAPRPRDISDALMDRTRFLPASHLSVLAAAWLQFEVHDWMSHAKEPPIGDWLLDADMPLPKAIPTRRRPAGVRLPRAALVGRVAALRHAPGLRRRDRARATAEIAVDDDLLRALERQAANFNAPEASLWVGLAALLVLFAHEHNAIVRHLRAAYPEQGAPWLYAKARLVNSALMAKIHTVEWTPAIIGHPTTVGAIKATWWGSAGHEHRAHSRHEGESPRRAVRADRGVRHGLPAAPAAARRLHVRPARP